MNLKTVILADGQFPINDIPLGYLNSADRVICCDGAVEKLVEYGIEPAVIAGDMDSISQEMKQRYSDRLLFDGADQESNDLTKAVKHCIESGIDDAVILGATGLREDHTIGNISLLVEYSEFINVKMVTDRGIFVPLQSGSRISTWPGQQVSLFSNNPELEISSEGLRYPLRKLKLTNWWRGSLNESSADTISLTFEGGQVIVYLAF